MARRSREEVPSRRQFMGAAACAAVGTLGITSAIWDLKLISAAAGQSSGNDDYKALVCLFLYGGNDSNNWVVPYDTTRYNLYANARQNMALPQADLLPVTRTGQSTPDYSFHPCRDGNGVNRGAAFQQLWNAGALAVLPNVGSLVYPMNRTQYQNNSVPRPLQLFSHNDQQVQWQTSVPDQFSRTGWGGRVADLLHTLNTNSTVSMSMSVAGSNTWEIGSKVNQLSVSTSGVVKLTAPNTTEGTARLNAMRQLFRFKDAGGNYVPSIIPENLQVRAFANAMDMADSNAATVSDVLAAHPNPPTVFPNSSLGNQLRLISRLIASGVDLSHKRQVFFCSAGGYDTHGAQGLATGTQSNLLGDVALSVKAFYDEMVRQGLQNKVTLFTGSDFGRTFPTNNDDAARAGSDHGWGSHHIVVGGAVKGGNVHGNWPSMVVNSQDDTGLGRWIPGIAVDQYAATLAKWFGVSNSDLDTILPNLSHFATRDLGFML